MAEREHEYQKDRIEIPGNKEWSVLEVNYGSRARIGDYMAIGVRVVRVRVRFRVRLILT
jgi:predicted component of type VI protein secretion system